MNTLKKGSDILIKLKTGINVTFTKINLDYYTNESNHVECTLDNDKVVKRDDNYYAVLNHEDTINFNGILRCDSTIAWVNDLYDDNEQEVSRSQYLKIKIV